MLLPKGTTVAVADGEKLNLFRNTGDEAGMKLTALPPPAIDAETRSSGGRHSSSANPEPGHPREDGFSVGVVKYLNQQVLSGSIDGLVIVAAPRALGEMRKHYHKALSAILRGEITKDLTGHSTSDIEKAVTAA